MKIERVIGLGNALTDVLVNLPNDQVLNEFELARGSMSLVDAELQKRISEKTADLPHTLSLGGSAANTIRAMAKLGQKVGFIGKVGDDYRGDFYKKALENLTIEPLLWRGRANSGCCVSLVSADGERTMATYLGAALELDDAEINSDIFNGYDCLYIEGYLVQNYQLIAGAVSKAKERGLKVAIDLASYNIVAENLPFLRELVEKHVDILFANEQEAEAFTGENNPKTAMEAIAEKCELTVVKIGTRGAYIRKGDDFVHVGIMAAAKRVDTTGAGDFYAAGFLSGLCQNMSLRQCGTIGAIAAGKVIEVVGTTFGEEVWTEIHRLAEKVKTERYLF